MCTNRVAERRLIAVNLGIIVGIVVAVALAAWQGWLGVFDGRGVLAIVALVVVAVLALERDRIETGR